MILWNHVSNLLKHLYLFRLYQDSDRLQADRKVEEERGPEKYEPNPEFDFVKLPDAEKRDPPEPSANGEHKG